ncbi:keratin-associated protein 13-1 [Pteropus alecto]|uniref:Keratin-associated protein n=1 Tax=Pteropus alecto TaxID=9402 RepID=L5KX25_PTEAL|nr:keratin-associated protein 13-1 [Pteropus alecto]ELK15937.1 Keratin-associated protein 13-1 [Pteropus alecto]
MSYNCCSGNFSSRSLGGYLRSPRSSCGSSYPSNLVCSTDLRSPSTCQLGSSLYRGCQEICCEPITCQTSCYRPRTSILCNPCRSTYTTSLGSGSRSSCSLSYGSRSCYSLGCGSRSFRPLHSGVCGVPFLRYGSGFYCPTYYASRSCQSSCYRPTCGSGFY